MEGLQSPIIMMGDAHPTGMFIIVTLVLLYTIMKSHKKTTHT